VGERTILYCEHGHEMHCLCWRERADKPKAALELIRDSNRHAAFCTWSKATKRRTRTECSPGCPVRIAKEALGGDRG